MTGHSIPAHRYTAALAEEIETRWQQWWDDKGTFHTPNNVGPLADPSSIDGRGEKLFVLDMFPYPSGSGLHVGHPLGFIGTDVYARFKRMVGFNVLHAMGFDAFGLPAEQFAVEHGQHPAITTEQNIATYRRQLRRLGLAHDARRTFSTTDPSYYRWTQWIFSQVFNAWYDTDLDRARPITELIAELEAGVRSHPDGRTWNEIAPSEQTSFVNDQRLAYVSNAPVNWCPGLGTVVANEEVTSDNRSDRGNFPVFKRNMRQWMMRITTYADRLVDDLDLLEWSDAMKTMQRNWIGRSHGANVRFGCEAGEIEVYTTRPDTLFGATFLVLAPEHPLVPPLTASGRAEAVSAYCSEAMAKGEIERSDGTREKTGVFTGSYAINPITGREVPIWVADYVLAGYGTGAIMAVPAGDARDFEFARAFDIEVIPIQEPPADWLETHDLSIEKVRDGSQWPAAFVGEAPYINSSNDSLDLSVATTTTQAIAMAAQWLEATGHGESASQYKLRDWLFSRQRYWGEPFPIVYDSDGHPHTLPDDMLPVELPETEDFSPRTFADDDAESNPETPLDRLPDWVNVTLDLGNGPQQYTRDTNVMPQWAGSCWYQLRYCDPLNVDAFVDSAIEEYWTGPQTDKRADHPGGVDLYVGGVEHAVLHLLYARFWHKVLYDLGHVSSTEPYVGLFNQGYVLAEAFTDERGIYVDAFAVEKHGESYTLDGEPVTREFGKMGKSLKNGVSPDEMYGQYGADTLRLHEMAAAPLDVSRPWSSDGAVGPFRFLQRLWRNVVDEETGECLVVDIDPDVGLERLVHRTVEFVRAEMDALRFNTALASLIELNNAITKLDAVPRSVAERLTRLVAPFAPHIAEELWSKLGYAGSIAYESFPEADQSFLIEEQTEYPIQINGKLRSRISVAAGTPVGEVEEQALAEPKVVERLGKTQPKKVVVVPGRMVSIVI